MILVPPSQNLCPDLLNHSGSASGIQKGTRSGMICTLRGYLWKNTYLCSELIQNDMNLRDIKKDIEYVIGAFVDDCSLFLTVHPGKNADAVTDLVDEAVDLYNDLRDKVGAAKGGGKNVYDSIRKELLEKTDALYDRLSAAVKEGIAE